MTENDRLQQTLHKLSNAFLARACEHPEEARGEAEELVHLGLTAKDAEVRFKAANNLLVSWLRVRRFKLRTSAT